jgi:hypothetical protein
MTLETIVLPLEQSRALVEAGIVLDTAMVYLLYSHLNGSHETWYPREKEGQPELNMRNAVPAPVLSELLDAIRAKADAMETKVDRGMKLERHEWDGKIDWELVGQGKGNCEDDWCEAEGKDSTDLLAAAALLMEVSK